MKILIVDDEESIISLLCEFFSEKEDYQVDVAANGKEALERLKGKSYDLVITDHDMPEMTGVELVRKIKQSDASVKIVMISGYPNMQEFVAKSIGADEYLAKPLRLKMLEEIVDKYNRDKKSG